MDMVTYAALQKQMQESGFSVPEKVSAFENDAGYQTQQDVLDAIESAGDNVHIVHFEDITFDDDGNGTLPEGALDGFDDAYNAGKLIVARIKTLFNGKKDSFLTLHTYSKYLASTFEGVIHFGVNAGESKVHWGVYSFYRDGRVQRTIENVLTEECLVQDNPFNSSQNYTNRVASVASFAKIANQPNGVPLLDSGAKLAIGVVPAEIEISDSATDETVPTTKAVYNAIAENANCFFYVPFKLGTTGFELDGVTYAEILTAYNAGKRIIGKGYVPSAAGLGVSGNFELPLTYLTDSNVFVLNLISGTGTSEAWIFSDNTITTYPRVLETTSNKVDSLSASATNDQYPSAKAVYDYVRNNTGGGSSGIYYIDVDIECVDNVYSFGREISAEEYTEIMAAFNANRDVKVRATFYDEDAGAAKVHFFNNNFFCKYPNLTNATFLYLGDSHVSADSVFSSSKSACIDMETDEDTGEYLGGGIYMHGG